MKPTRPTIGHFLTLLVPFLVRYTLRERPLAVANKFSAAGALGLIHLGACHGPHPLVSSAAQDQLYQMVRRFSANEWRRRADSHPHVNAESRRPALAGHLRTRQ